MSSPITASISATRPTMRWQFNFDAQYVSATHDTLDMSVFGSNFSDQELDLTGGLPVITPHKPLTLSATWAAPNPTMAGQTDEQYFTDRQWTFWRAAMDHIEHSEGEEVASQFDVAYNFQDDGFLQRIKFGARYADRDQTIRYTTYNWGAISEVWSGTAVFMDQAGTDRTEFFEFDNYLPRRHGRAARRLFLQSRPDRRLCRRRQFLQEPQRLLAHEQRRRRRPIAGCRCANALASSPEPTICRAKSRR